MAKWPIAWRARWIWCDPPPLTVLPIAPASLPPRQTWNRFCYLRRTFELPKVPAEVPARVTADSRFVLYLNGIEVARGPARSVPARLSYLELDLEPHLRAGENVIAAIVRFYGVPGPWWIPAPPSYQLGFGSFAFEAPALGIVSDSSWKGHPAPYRSEVGDSRGLPAAPIEDFDGAEVPYGWTEPGFDDSGWKHGTELSAGTLAVNRVVIPVEPYTAAELADIAPLTAIPIAFKEISRRRTIAIDADDPRDAYPPAEGDSGDRSDTTIVTFDAGAVTLATPWVEARGSRGAIVDLYVDLYVGEDLRSDSAAEIRPRFYAARYRLAGTGVERVEGFEAVGFRYLTVVARGGADLRSAGAIERRYPRPGEACFASDDERLNALWKVGARTLDLCSTHAFVDCPFREQRAWLGDSYIHSLLTYVTSTDWRLVRRHLRIAAHSQRADGLLAMVAAGDFSISSTTCRDGSFSTGR